MRNNELSSMLYQRYNVPRNSVIASRELLSSPRERGAGGEARIKSKGKKSRNSMADRKRAAWCISGERY